jgi:hypothetical protein
MSSGLQNSFNLQNYLEVILSETTHHMNKYNVHRIFCKAQMYLKPLSPELREEVAVLDGRVAQTIALVPMNQSGSVYGRAGLYAKR